MQYQHHSSYMSLLARPYAEVLRNSDHDFNTRLFTLAKTNAAFSQASLPNYHGPTRILNLLSAKQAWSLNPRHEHLVKPFQYYCCCKGKFRRHHSRTFVRLWFPAGSLPCCSWKVPEALPFAVGDVEGLTVNFGC